jgi:predicted nucleotidyltransferase
MRSPGSGSPSNRRGRRLPAVDPRIAEVVRRIVAFLSPQRVILYGSRARGDNVPKSDIDLAVDAPPGPGRVRAHFDLLGDLERDPPTLLGIDIVFLDEVGEEFRLRVAREGQVLYERRPLQALPSRLAPHALRPLHRRRETRPLPPQEGALMVDDG